MCGCNKETSIPGINAINNTQSKTNSDSDAVGNVCNLSNVEVMIDLIEIAHKEGVTPYLDKVKVFLSDDSINLDSMVLHIGGGVNIDVTDYTRESDGVLVFDYFDNQRNVEFNPMDDKMILSLISKDKFGNMNCVKNIYP